VENMENQSSVGAPALDTRGASSVLHVGEDWRLAREAHRELQIAGMPRTNLLLVGTAGVIPIVLEMVCLELREPILRWRPGQQLELPSPGRAATLVLQDVSALTHDNQRSVLRWLDQTAGRVRVVSTTAVPLWPRVKTGAFSDMLYYRLNTVFVDASSRKN
jgi:hypothetical protein